MGNSVGKTTCENLWKAAEKQVGRVRGLEPPTSRITICQFFLFINKFSHNIEKISTPISAGFWLSVGKDFYRFSHV